MEMRNIKRKCNSLLIERTKMENFRKKGDDKRILKSVKKQESMIKNLKKHFEANSPKESGPAKKHVMDLITKMESGDSFEQAYADFMINTSKTSEFANENHDRIGERWKGVGIKEIKHGLIRLEAPLNQGELSDLHSALMKKGFRLQAFEKQVLFNKVLHEEI